MGARKRIIVGMSGGVDSAVAALLLQQQGWLVEGMFMKNWEEDDREEYCAAAADLADAQSVAEQLAIRLHTVNFSSEYWDRVFSHFLAEYRAGRTPNPDVLCNSEIKFGAFLDHALRLGAQRIATGHYARLCASDDQVQLLRALDTDKDQTYFLYRLDQRQLALSLFPLGERTKSQVRKIAAAAGFGNHAKKDSTGICFIGERRFRDFLATYLPESPGDIVTPDGTVVGRHHGLMYYTLGQRRGLGIGGVATANEAPWFVVAKDLARNELTVAQEHAHPWLLARGLRASQMHWIGGRPPEMPLRCQARCRHRQALQPCQVQMHDGACRVIFKHPQRALTPGQSVVFYAGNVCLGGGIIESTFHPED